MKYSTQEALRVIANHGLIGRVSAQGGFIAIYEGEEHEPGTWMECGRVAIQKGQVQSAALELECV